MSETYISILRGINVSGQKKIRMADLKELYEELGFSDVSTYIQSGNVIFRPPGRVSEQELSERIENKIKDTYNFSVPVIIRSADEMRRTVEANPFLFEQHGQMDKLHVTFLGEKPPSAEVNALHEMDFSPEKFKIIEREIYLYCPKGYGRTRLSNNFFESRLGVKATTRNWKTVSRLAEMSS